MLDTPAPARGLAPLWLLALVAIATIGGAWYSQLVVGFIPCELCLKQRIPYYVGIPVALIGIVLAAMGLTGRTVRWFALAAAAVFLVSIGLGAYHAGVEWHFWLGPADCGGGAATPGKVGDLLSAMQSARIVSCTEAAWRFLGISFAGWNAIVSALLAALGLTSFVRLGR